jgi:peptidoglycan hydrolase CwlO-like protein
MTKPKETYSTEKAWGKDGTNAQADVFRSLADGLRRENLLIKKMLDERDKKITEQEIYIEQLENKVESLRESIQVLETAYKKRIVPTIK